MDARRVNAGHDQVPPFHVRMRCIGAQAGAARVPAKVMQFVAGLRHVRLPHQPAVALGIRVHINDAKRIRVPMLFRADECDVRQTLRRRLHSHLGRRVKRRIRSHQWHGVLLVFFSLVEGEFLPSGPDSSMPGTPFLLLNAPGLLDILIEVCDA